MKRPIYEVQFPGTLGRTAPSPVGDQPVLKPLKSSCTISRFTRFSVAMTHGGATEDGDGATEDGGGGTDDAARLFT